VFTLRYTQHKNNHYTRTFSTNNFICILYFNVCITIYLKFNVLYLCIGCMFFVTHPLYNTSLYMATTCRRFSTHTINSHILRALGSVLMLKHQCMVMQYLKFLKLFVWLLHIIIIFISSNNKWPFSGQYLNNGVSLTLPVSFMVDRSS